MKKKKNFIIPNKEGLRSFVVGAKVGRVCSFGATIFFSLMSSYSSGNTSPNFGFSKFHWMDLTAYARLVGSGRSMLPVVGVSSSINDSRPVRIEATLHVGFHVPGWKSLIERQRRVLVLKRPFGVIM
eukprot:Lithocolla_globosa_v1_NODE_5090_length_1307_cov_19.570288.p3 type:complete len:127 gc:universal NODE_5090_length_1307_cov_19.570288:686-1066(+)